MKSSVIFTNVKRLFWSVVFLPGWPNIHLFWCDPKSCIGGTVSCGVPWNSMNNTFTCTVKKMCLLIPLPQHLCLFDQSKIKGDVHSLTFMQCFLSTRTQCGGLICINTPNTDHPFTKWVVKDTEHNYSLILQLRFGSSNRPFVEKMCPCCPTWPADTSTI